jgi:hypothetical protein
VAVQQNFDYELSLWRPVVRRITDDQLWASVTQVNDESFVSIPVTSQAVYREEDTAAYLQAPFSELVGGAISQCLTVTSGSRSGYPYATTMPKLEYDTDYERMVFNLADNPNWASLDPANYIGSRFVMNEMVASPSTATYGLTPFQAGTYGLHPQVVTSTTPEFYEDNGTGTFQTKQDVWIVSGISDGLAGSPYAPLGAYRVLSVSERLSSGNGVTVSTVSYGTSSSFNRLFPACCVIESDAYKDFLFHCGGFSTWPGTISSVTTVFHREGTRTLVMSPAPYPVAKAGCVFNKDQGVVIVTGGATTTAPYCTNAGAFFNPQTEIWTSMVGTLNTARRDHKIVNVQEGVFLIIGGRSGVMDTVGHPDAEPVGVPIAECELLVMDTPVNIIPPIKTGSMSDARFAFGVCQLPDSRILVCGGVGWNKSNAGTILATEPELNLELRSCEIYDYETGIWTPIQGMHQPHSYCTCFYNKTLNRVYVYGGFDSRAVEWLDLETMEWHISTTVMSSANALTTGVKVCETVGFAPGGGTNNGTDLVTNTSCNALLTWNKFENRRTDGFNGCELTIKESSTGNIYIKNENYLGNFVGSEYALSNGATSFAEAFEAPPTTTGFGCFAWDLGQPFGISEQFTLNQEIQQGYKYNEIEVTSNIAIPEGTSIVLNYGYSTQTGPIKTFGLYGTKLRVDPGFVFPFTIASGSTCNILTHGTYQPATNELLGQFWLTASNAARALAIDTLRKITAANIPLTIETRYPGDRGLGNEGSPIKGNYKISEIVSCYGKDDLDLELEEARNGK